jgi:type II secretory pathway component PulK
LHVDRSAERNDFEQFKLFVLYFFLIVHDEFIEIEDNAMRIRKKRGIVLLLVLVVVSVLAMMCLGFCDLMQSERRGAILASQQSQSRTLAQSGVELARQFLDRTATEQTNAGGIYDNISRFKEVLIADGTLPQERGRCSLIAPKIENREVLGVRYGLLDESTKINLTTLLTFEKTSKGSAKSILMALPSMTEEIAESILDWMDSDDTARPNGAESSYYGTLTSPYGPRNGSPVTIEELLRVRGVTPELLFGLDAARMGLIPAEEAADGSLNNVDNTDGLMDHGWAAYLTLWSAETNLASDGTQKVNLNSKDLKQLETDLKTALGNDEMATFIVAYRQNGQYRGHENTSPSSGGTLDYSKKASTTISSPLELIGIRTTAKFQGQEKTSTLKSPFGKDSGSMSTYLPKLLGKTTTSSDSSTPGRININQAPRAVLLCIPGMTASIADQIIAKRTLDPVKMTEAHQYETWPLTEGIVPLELMKSLYPFVTAKGSVYRVQSLGYFEKGGVSSRIEAILDSTQSTTKLLFWKDISRMPGGFPVEPSESERTSVP